MTSGRLLAAAFAAVPVVAPAPGATPLSATVAAQSAHDEPPPAPRELRAAWVATVANIDWPSAKGLSSDAQRAELSAILDRARELRLNALVFQIRPGCDALYPSELEPWAEWLTGAQGRAPEPAWDPLAEAIAGAHRRGLELHAWFNPFRAGHPRAESPSTDLHVTRRHPQWVVRYGTQTWLDPGIPEVREHSLRVVRDVVARYDVDGIHYDDYFYPYPEGRAAFGDDASYAAYRAGGGELARDDWRRANVDDFVRRLYAMVREVKPWVRVGISPFGIARPDVPRGIRAGVDQFAQLYADVPKWLAEGWCDYLSPQLYWPIAQREQSYTKLLAWWTTQNPRGRHLWIGNNASRAASGGESWKPGEIVRQIEATRATAGAGGNIHFSMRALLDSRGSLGRELRDGPYRTPALVPASPWLGAEPPAAPVVRVDDAEGDELVLRWERDPDASRYAIYARGASGWRLLDVVGAELPGARLSRRGVRAVAVSALGRSGVESARTVLDPR